MGKRIRGHGNPTSASWLNLGNDSWAWAERSLETSWKQPRKTKRMGAYLWWSWWGWSPLPFLRNLRTRCWSRWGWGPTPSPAGGPAARRNEKEKGKKKRETKDKGEEGGFWVGDVYSGQEICLECWVQTGRREAAPPLEGDKHCYVRRVSEYTPLLLYWLTRERGEDGEAAIGSRAEPAVIYAPGNARANYSSFQSNHRLQRSSGSPGLLLRYEPRHPSCMCVCVFSLI